MLILGKTAIICCEGQPIAPVAPAACLWDISARYAVGYLWFCSMNSFVQG